MSNPEPTVDASTNIKSLSDAAWLLFQTSMEKYHQISLDHWQMVSGEAKPDLEKLTQNAWAFFANASRDMSNLTMVWQKAANLAATSNPAAPSTGTSNQPGTNQPGNTNP